MSAPSSRSASRTSYGSCDDGLHNDHLLRPSPRRNFLPENNVSSLTAWKVTSLIGVILFSVGVAWSIRVRSGKCPWAVRFSKVYNTPPLIPPVVMASVGCVLSIAGILGHVHKRQKNPLMA